MTRPSREEWAAVVRAVEQALPLYERVSELISLGLASSLRSRGVQELASQRREWVLDLGSGPGVSSILLVKYGFDKIVGVDPSKNLLIYSKKILGTRFNPVQATAEHLPFKSHSFSGAITCFALRDVMDLEQSLEELGRTVALDDKLVIVDIGKPDSIILQKLVTIYVRMVMPFLARILISGRLSGNPFRMIIPTYARLGTNKNLLFRVRRFFGPARFKPFLFGGLILIVADHSGHQPIRDPLNLYLVQH